MEQFKIDKGIFSFLAKRGLMVSEMRHVLKKYASFLGIKQPKKNRMKWYADISESAQKDFTAFKKIYNANKPAKNVHSYDAWYEEASMDGSLAYNGSADDF